MGEVKWTSEQQAVIDLRNRNILVSAAAGSGKTAVLVERIIKRITDKENPVDIDRILVVTFTRAAASEMRERIGKAIDKLLEENPDDSNLIKQSTLVYNAKITTIDSFCLFVVRNHFEEINLDPNFRVADQGEITLIENEVLDLLFEKNYNESDNENFLKLVDYYSKARNDDIIRSYVYEIYKASKSSSWPISWIKNLSNLYDAKTLEEFQESSLIKELYDNTKTTIKEHLEMLNLCLEASKVSNDGERYLPTILGDIELLSGIDDVNTFTELYEFISKISFAAWPRYRKTDAEKKAIIIDNMKAVRDDAKGEIKKLKEKYFSMNIEEYFEQTIRIAPFVKELIRLALDYYEMMMEKKTKKRLVEFSDIEHFALQILKTEDSDEIKPVAKEFKEHFEEIMIDEYQDSNNVQEDIMRAISRESEGQNNMFMVGDVKQSIYRFRQARPELFMEKYESFTSKESNNQKIDLHKNFRSRREVIDFTNDIFFKIMSKDIGNVEYDNQAALYLGANYKEDKGHETEVFITALDSDMKEALEKNNENVSNKRRIEALSIAFKIKQLMKELKVTDKDSHELRDVRYSDIVILLRSTSGFGEEFVQTLSECDIPAFIKSKTGYFMAYEIQIILNFLRILDNPYQDIPMASVLKSPIVGLDDEELAEIRVRDKSIDFCQCVLEAMADEENEKLFEFGLMYERLRSYVADTPIHELIEIILAETGFRDYAGAMPAGDIRRQNIDILIEKAIAYEQTSYKGLFHFIRYIELLKKYEIDDGEADALEDENYVRIMTIHKSKGLEFPIVFLAGTSKNFNMSDSKGEFLIHSDLGIGLDERLINPRRKIKSLPTALIANRFIHEDLGEELRILYVALTRAKEKLIITGVTEKEPEKWLASFTGNTLNKPLFYSSRIAARSYLDWIVPAVLSYPSKYNVEFFEPEDVAVKVAKEIAKSKINEEIILEEIENTSEEKAKELSKYFDYKYKYQIEAKQKAKYSVSDLKHSSMVANYDREVGDAQRPDFLEEDREKYIPKFARENDAIIKTDVNKGALTGTAVHRVMECLDFKEILKIDKDDENEVKDFVRKALDNMHGSGMLSHELYQLINPNVIETFVKSDIAYRMAQADSKGNLFKEKPFVMKDTKENYLIQGIIDVFWMEDDEIVVLDYKTDRVINSEELVLRYKTQLDLYANALARIFSTKERIVKVKESLIYSFRLQEVIKL